MLDDLGLVAALEWQAREVGNGSGLQVEVEAPETAGELPEPQRICIFRVAQEALRNCARHASATHVRVALDRVSTHVLLKVEDDGRGFQPGRSKGLGLLGMEERVAQLGGRRFTAGTGHNDHRRPACMNAVHPLRVLVADDHPIVRSGLRLVLERDRDLVVAGETADGSEAVEWMDRQPAEVAILDIAMPRLNGIDAAAQILRKHPSTAVILLSMHSDETYVLRALRAGARGYVLKESAEGELLAAVRTVVGGRSYFSPKVARILQQEHVQQLRRAGAVDTFDLLTERERQILQLIAEGNSNKETAARLFLSVYTVETHRKNILQKLNLHGTADLILYAVRKNMLA